ncbi:MAG: hypothetical protein U5K27_10360 [Desulfotignum sp.]|nr:hypothetical protein [Desulfotignum sp.]
MLRGDDKDVADNEATIKEALHALCDELGAKFMQSQKTRPCGGIAVETSPKIQRSLR